MPDGLLHPASHLSGSLRHAQLDVAGAPKLGEAFVRGVPLWLGHLIHEDVHRILRKVGIPYMAEVNLTPWLPRGWGGTADGVVWNPELKAFVLADFKTSKGEAMRYIERDGAKADHVAQTSLYWHGLKKMGLPLAKKIGVYYIPKNETRSKTDIIEPLLMDFDPLPRARLARETKLRFSRLNEYEDSLPFIPPSVLAREGVEILTPAVETGEWLTDALEPVQERTQRIHFVSRTSSHDVKLAPHWSAAYCPFPDTLCSCSSQGEEKIGYYEPDGNYVPRKGYEDIEPLVAPA